MPRGTKEITRNSLIEKKLKLLEALETIISNPETSPEYRMQAIEQHNTASEQLTKLINGIKPYKRGKTKKQQPERGSFLST